MQWEQQKASTNDWYKCSSKGPSQLSSSVLGSQWSQQTTEPERGSRIWILVPPRHQHLHSNFRFDKIACLLSQVGPNACLDFCRKSSGVLAHCGQWEPSKLNKSEMKHLEGIHPTISVFQSVPPHQIMFQEHCFYRRIYLEGHLPNFTWAQMPLGAAQ